MILVGNFPFNSFLSGFICHIGIFALAGNRSCILGTLLALNYLLTSCNIIVSLVCLRLQLTSKGEFDSFTPEKAFGDFAFCALVLLFVVFSFLG